MATTRQRENTRFDYSPIVDRKPWRLPNGARLAIWVIPNIEHFLFDRPSTSITAQTIHTVPDIMNYSWRDYGVRVGIWRLMEILDRHRIRATVALNSDVCTHYPQIVQAGKELHWEWMGHGENNSAFMSGLPRAKEAALIKRVRGIIEKATGTAPRGWLSPALTESFNTPDLLAAAGFDYVANWVNDEQPYPMKVRKGSLLSIPYSIEINDIPAFVDHGHTADSFRQLICDQFDALYEDAAASARVMAICLHPFITGHPHQAKYLNRAFEHIARRDGAWFATGSEIADAYRAVAKR